MASADSPNCLASLESRVNCKASALRPGSWRTLGPVLSQGASSGTLLVVEIPWNGGARGEGLDERNAKRSPAIAIRRGPERCRP